MYVVQKAMLYIRTSQNYGLAKSKMHKKNIKQEIFKGVGPRENRQIYDFRFFGFNLFLKYC